MTKIVCEWCGRRFPERGGRGRPRRFCRQYCRQAAYEARRLAEAHGLEPGDVIVQGSEVTELNSLLWCLRAALDDVAHDMAAGGEDPEELKRVLGWLRENAEPLAHVELTARTLT